MYLQVDRQALRRKRVERLLTQAQLAEAAGVHRNTVIRAESEDGLPVLQLTVHRIALALGCEPTELARYSEREAIEA